MKREFKLYELHIQRGPVTWDVPYPRATSIDGLVDEIRKAATKPFTRIEICDVSHWNGPGACSVTLTKDCPKMGGA